MSDQGFPPQPQPWDGPQVPPPPPPPAPAASAGPTQDERTFALLIHLSTLVSHFIGPLVLWLVKRDTSTFVDHHGKEALNFQITMLGGYILATIVATCTFGIGALLFLPLAAVQIVCSILAAVKANEGVLWRYPITIRFIS